MEACGKEIRTRGKIVRVAFLDGEGFQFTENPAAASAALRKSGPRADLFTFIQRLADTSPKYSYPMELDNFAVLPVTTFEHWWTQQIGFKARNKAKQAGKKGVVIKEVPFDDSLVQGIHAIYNECPLRQGKRFRHYGKDLEAVGKMSATFLDRSVFIGAFFEDNLIGFVKLVADEHRSQAGLMHVVSMVRHQDKAPTNALIAQAVRSCAERGIPNLWYANFFYGKKERSSLRDFKERNGFCRVDVPRYYVPLTLLGSAALRLGFHRELANWIPEPVADTYRRIRGAWYAKRFPHLENA
jgi:hypothetical protein